MNIRSDNAGGEGYRGKVKGMILDWSGTTADAYVLAPVIFREVGPSATWCFATSSS